MVGGMWGDMVGHCRSIWGPWLGAWQNVWEGVWWRQDWWLGVWQDHDKIFLFTLLKLIDCGISYAFKTYFFGVSGHYPTGNKSKAVEFLLRRLELWELCFLKCQFPHPKKVSPGKVGS